MDLLSSRVVITDEALVAEANRLTGSSPLSLGPQSPGCQLLKMVPQDGSVLDLSRKAVKEPSGMKLVARAEEMELPRDVEIGVLGGENINNLPSGLVEFGNCLGMPIAGFEKEICALIRKMESRKGRGIRMSGGKKRCSSHFEREIQKLECSINYNSSPFTAKVKGSGARV